MNKTRSPPAAGGSGFSREKKRPRDAEPTTRPPAEARAAEPVEPADDADDAARGMRVPRTLGDVTRGSFRILDILNDGSPSEEEKDEATERDASGDEDPVVGSQEEVVQGGPGGGSTNHPNHPGDANDEDPSSLALLVPRAHAAFGSRWNPTDSAMTALAKAALHASDAGAPPGEVRCREAERKRLVDVVTRGLKSRRSASAYACGLPGTGKSLTVAEVERVARAWGDGSKLGGGGKHLAKRASDRPRVAAVNCMALADPRLVFARIVEELTHSQSSRKGGAREGGSGGGGAGSAREEEPARARRNGGGDQKSSERDAAAASDAASLSDLATLPEVAQLRALVAGEDARGGPMSVILLDEMDQLASKAQGVLYELFGLPTLPGSRCVVIGVANGINLVETTLPRLAARGCEPTVVRFHAYDKDQIRALLRQRLGGLPWKVFEEAGLELCARKVAAATGDMRRALSICAAAVDMCAREASDQFSAADPNGASNGASSGGDGSSSLSLGSDRRAPATAALGALVKISHVARAVSASFSSPVVDTMRGLPQHQQMVLCAAVRLFREEGSRREATLGVLNDRYTALCKEAQIRGLTPGEFSGVCTVLADQTLLKVGPGREDRRRKTSLAVHQDDVVFALQGVNFFRNLIGDTRKGTGKA